jgi:glycerophosphoryl diester phosphodiesterase
MKLNFNPPVIAHRGASAYAPENTLAAFTKAVQLGIKWIEFDVMLAACGEVVIFHDAQLNRTTQTEGTLRQHTYDYLRSLDAGAWFDLRFSGERIPTLAQALAFLKETHTAANIELKAEEGLETQLIQRILETIKPYFSVADSAILFSSFSKDALISLRHQAPHCHIGLLLDEWDSHWKDFSISLQCASIHVNEKIMTSAIAHDIKKMNKALLCYTVNRPSRAQELYALGVDAVFSDVPDLILRG